MSDQSSQTLSPNVPPVAVDVTLGSPTITGVSALVPSSSGTSPSIRVIHPLLLPRSQPPTAQSKIVTHSIRQSEPSDRLAGNVSSQQLALPKRPSPQAVTSATKRMNFNVRVINPDKKKEWSVYVVRDIGEDTSTPQKLMEELQKQLGPQLVPKTHRFPVGYIKGSTKVSIRSAADVADIWMHVKRGNQISLWCEGIRSCSEVSDSESDSDDESATKKKRRRKKRKLSALDEKNNRVEDIVGTLREKHGAHYTTIQYRLWAEMVDIGTHRLDLQLCIYIESVHVYSKSGNLCIGWNWYQDCG